MNGPIEEDDTIAEEVESPAAYNDSSKERLPTEEWISPTALKQRA